MKFNYIHLIVFLLLLASCKPDKAKLLIGKWHVVKFENNLQKLTGKWDAVKLNNPEMDSFFKNGQRYIDTVGKNNDAATNLALYGIANMDSMRTILQRQLDSAKATQAMAVSNTSFVFTEDGMALLSFHGSIDSSNWYIDSTGSLVLADLNEESKGEKLNLEIISVSNTALVLRFRDNNSFSIVTFHPDGAKKNSTDPMVETWFTFRKDSIALLNFNSVIDSARWFLEGDTAINIRSSDKSFEGDIMKWGVISLDEKTLVLKVTENTSISTLTFNKDGK